MSAKKAFIGTCIFVMILIAADILFENKIKKSASKDQYSQRVLEVEEAFHHPFDDLRGRSAPNIQLKLLDGHILSLAGTRGNPVLLSFFSVKYCPICLKQLPILEEVSNEYRQQGLEVIGIIKQLSGRAASVEEINGALRQSGITFPVAIGDETTSEAFGHLKIVPGNIYVDRNGDIFSQTGGQNRDQIEKTLSSLIQAKK